MASAGDARRLAALFVETNLSMRPDEARQLYEGASLLRIGGADGFVRDALRGIIGVRRGETGAVERMQRALATHLTARPHPDVGLSMVAAWTALGLARPQDVRPTLGPHGISIGDDEATSAHLALLLGVSDCWLGDLPRGAHALRTCLGLATRPEQAVEAALAHLLLGKALALQGDVVTARAELARGRQLAARCGAMALGNGHLECSVYLPLVTGDDEDFVARLELLGGSERGELSGLGPDYRLELATVAATRGDAVRARELTRELRQGTYAGRPVSRFMRAWAAWAADPGSTSALEAATALATRPQDPAEAIPAMRLTWLLGSDHARRGRRGEAIRLLESAGERATTMGALGYVRLIEAEVAALVRPGGAPAPRTNGHDRTAAGALTQAELRVAHAVCRGLSNREVAALLVLSERTVEAHLTNIYRKLEVRSRTELVLRL